ncbi:MAG: carboxylating nicotinate-nucleotide diphosphorylase [Bacteroidota bacterium]|nr:carboxylating nicotinate-nucleotide diphosphorylase [Bacteroidota bacterium]
MEKYINELIELAVKEDIGDGDHTSLACVPENLEGEVKLLVKEAGILAGVQVAVKVLKRVDPDLEIEIFLADGSPVKPGDIAFTVSGKTQSILQAERLLLNFMQRMSGIATETARYASEISDLKTTILDTRKTTPGLRAIEKLAVKIGGGDNHRMGLHDMIMIKDNHVDFAGGVHPAIQKTKDYLYKTGRNLKIELEVRNFDELNEALQTGGIDRIMLDNFTPEQTQKAVKLIDGNCETESSGGITFETLRAYAECGVDYISVGALTHQIKSLDLSLKAV